MGPAWRSRTSVVRMASHLPCRLQVSLLIGAPYQQSGLAHRGSCRLLQVLMVCSRTASAQGSAAM